MDVRSRAMVLPSPQATYPKLPKVFEMYKTEIALHIKFLHRLLTSVCSAPVGLLQMLQICQ